MELFELLRAIWRRLVAPQRGYDADGRSVFVPRAITVRAMENGAPRPQLVNTEIFGKVELGRGVRLNGCRLLGQVICDDYCSINGPGTVLASYVNPIKVGRFSSIAMNVSVHEANHTTNTPTTFFINTRFGDGDTKKDVCSKGPVVIEENVWVGSHAAILSGVTVGRGSIVSSGAVVTKDVPRYTVVAGIPAHVIKRRFTDVQITLLEESAFWEWSEEQLRTQLAFLTTPLCLDTDML